MNEKATAIEKTLEILTAFAPDNQPLGTIEISKKLGYHKATTSRILSTLAEYGFVYQDSKSKKYRLGAKVYELGRLFGETFTDQIVQIAQPHVDKLRDAVNETIVLEVWSGNRTVVAYEAESLRQLRVTGRNGSHIPAVHAAAGAKAILSLSDPDRVDAALRGKLYACTPNTITDPNILKAQLVTYKERGYAVDNEELEIGISAAGVPILDYLGSAVAAIVLVAPTARFTDAPTSQMITLLRTTAEAITGQLNQMIDYRS